jgi:hypothetical protein
MGRNALGILDRAILLRQYFVCGEQDYLECGAPAPLWYWRFSTCNGSRKSSQYQSGVKPPHSNEGGDSKGLDFNLVKVETNALVFGKAI